MKQPSGPPKTRIKPHELAGTLHGLFLIAFVAMGIALALGRPSTYAELDSSAWSTPALVFQSEGEISEPLVVADDSGGAQVFWLHRSFRAGSPEYGANLIYYARWDGKSWTKPVDVVASSQAAPSSAAADGRGTVHLLWHGFANALNYSRAAVAEAPSALRWALPVAVDATNRGAQILDDSAGRLHRVYAGLAASGLNYQVSTDGGNTWSFPVRISPTSSPNSSASTARLAIGDNGAIHVVWTEFQLPDGWPPLGVFYSRSGDGGRSWSSPVELAGLGYDQINVVTGRGNEVHVAWNGMVSIGGRYHRWSSDGGNTWSQTSTLTREGGTEGPPQLAVDSSGALHLLTTYGERAWYSSWQKDQGWTQFTYVATGAELGIPPSGPLSEQLRHLEEPSMAISNGNRLHAVFYDRRRGQGVSYLWYTSKEVSAPALPAASLPTVVPAPETDSTVLPTVRSTPEVSDKMVTNLGEAPTFPSPQSASLASIQVVALLLSSVVVFRFLRRTGR